MIEQNAVLKSHFTEIVKYVHICVLFLQNRIGCRCCKSMVKLCTCIYFFWEIFRSCGQFDAHFEGKLSCFELNVGHVRH